MKIGVLSFHGDVLEHIKATKHAADNLKLGCNIVSVRTLSDLANLNALIIPGGESTTLQKLCEREGMFEEMKKIKNIFGTCAGAILLAKVVHNKEADQRTLGLMDIEIERNSYGRQASSFEEEIDTKLGKINAVFIRAPKIRSISKNISILAEKNNEILACEEKTKEKFYLAATFHPELSTAKFHEYFLKNLI